MRGLLLKEWRQSGGLFCLVILLIGAFYINHSFKVVSTYQTTLQQHASQEFQKDDQEWPLSDADFESSLKVGETTLYTYAPVVLLLLLVLGFKQSAGERFRKNDYFTYGLPQPRWRIFWAKQLAFLPLALLSIGLFSGASMWYIYMKIPEMFLPPATMAVMIVFSSLAVYFFAFELTLCLGWLCGNLIFAILSTLLLFTSILYLIPTGVPSIWVSIQSFVEQKSVDVLWLNNLLAGLANYADFRSSASLITFLILGLVCGGCAYLVHQKMTLEYDGDFIILPKLRKPIWLFASLYVPFTWLCYMEIYHYSGFRMIGAEQFFGMCLGTLFILFITGIITHWLIFKTFPFSKKSRALPAK
ncbi:hypothetical protein [Listeria costaricensis]|uniref:hypothetical protein n=1 Tax=Listeria costaricensis TaxID=2026604 RepID=UPI000C07CD88|nr:hypothetical protein [Listeria costaricensis]